MWNKGDECQMDFSPKESPIYGGGEIVGVFSDTSDLPNEEADIFLVFQGSNSRHVTIAQRVNYTTVRAIIPGHDCPEPVEISCCTYEDGSVICLAEGTLSYTHVQDSTYYLAHFLASSVCDPAALENPSSIKSDRFDLWCEDRSTLDERLTAAFEHLDLSPNWRLVEDTSMLDQDPAPRETLLHFAARLNLPQFAELLLDKPGGDVALRLPNKNGELAVNLARSHGLDDLADRMNVHSLDNSSSHYPSDFARVHGKVKRHHNGTSTITSSTTESSPSLEEDIQMLREVADMMGEEGECPPARPTSVEPPSPDCFKVGSLPTRLPSEMQVPSTLSSGQSSQYFSAADDDFDDRGDEEDEEEDDDDDDDDDDEEEEEETERQDIPEEQVLEESLAHLHSLNSKVQRLRASNKEYLKAEDDRHARRESLSRFSSSCPVLADQKDVVYKPRTVSTPPPYMHMLDIPMREQSGTQYHHIEEDAETDESSALASSSNPIAEESSSYQEEEYLPDSTYGEEGSSPEESPQQKTGAVRINVNDTCTSVSDASRSEVATSGQLSPTQLDGSSSPDESSDNLLEVEEQPKRRHSWAPDPLEEVVNTKQESEGSDEFPLSLALRSKSMGNLDIGHVGSEEEFHDAKETQSPDSSKQSLEGLAHQDIGPSATSSPIDARDKEQRPASPDVSTDDKVNLTFNELPANNATPLPSQAEIDAVPLRPKKRDILKKNKNRQATSMLIGPRAKNYKPVLDFRTKASSGRDSTEQPITPDDSELPTSPHSAPPVVMLTLTGPGDLNPIQSMEEVDSNSDNNRDSDLDELTKEQLSRFQQRKNRLSLTEFLSDPRNFIGEPVQPVPKTEQPVQPSRVSLLQSEMETSKVSRKFSFLKKTKNKDKKEEKDKDKKDKDNERGKHQFLTVSFSNSTKCDYCDKSMVNKDALQCSTCSVNVHSSCKDHVQGCAKLNKHHKLKKSVSISRDRHSTIIPKPGVNLTPSQSMRETKRPGSYPHRVQQLPFQGSLTDLRQHGISPLAISGTIDESDEIEDGTASMAKPPSLSNNNISVSMESLDEVGTINIEDEDLVSKGPEPESWSVTAEKKVLKKMHHKVDIKRQDVIFEFIKTERHHVRTLKIMQKIFSHGMQNELKMDQNTINKVFPALDELTKIAVEFRDALQVKQRYGHPVETIGDVLVEQFDKENGKRMMKAYAFLCSRQIEAVALYKELYKNDRKFAVFIKKCSSNALCRRWSIPECILSVTNRLTKYHLLIGAIIKPTKSCKVDKSEVSNLQKALQLVKNICQDVNVQVKEYERHQKLMEIYNKLEARSSGLLKSGKKFKKSDLLSSNRKLRHAADLKWKSARGRLTDIYAVVLSDVIIFLQENNQKYTFASQDNKPPVIGLYKLMVRDVAIDKCSMYLISQNKAAPEMYEVNCDSSDNRKRWKEILEQAIHECPDEDEGVVEDAETDEERRSAEVRAAKIKKLLDQMQEKDRQLNEVMEEKAKLVEELKDTLIKDDALGTLKSPVIADSDSRMQEARQILLAAIAEAHRLTMAVYSAGAGLTRSASSAGERESGLFEAPTLPKRAETFGGFDKQQGPVVKERFMPTTKDHGSRSYSFPNLSNAESTDIIETDEHHAQQGSDPNLLSESYQETSSTQRKEPEPPDRSSDSSWLIVDSNSSLSEDATDASQRDEKRALSHDHVVSVNHLLKHLNSLLSLTSKKETAYESMRSQLLEANRKIESLSGLAPKPRTKAYSMGTQGLASLPRRGEKERSSSTTSDRSKLDLIEGRGRPTDSKDRIKRESPIEEKPNDPPPSPAKPIDQNKGRMIAYGEISYNNSTHAGHGAQADSPRSIMKHRGTNESPSPTEKSGTGGRRRDMVPPHLLSATNEFQQASSGLVQQQLPMKLSTLASQSSGKPPQLIPGKLASSSSATKSPALISPVLMRNGDRMSTGSKSRLASSSNDVIFF